MNRPMNIHLTLADQGFLFGGRSSAEDASRPYRGAAGAEGVRFGDGLYPSRIGDGSLDFLPWNGAF